MERHIKSREKNDDFMINYYLYLYALYITLIQSVFIFYTYMN